MRARTVRFGRRPGWRRRTARLWYAPPAAGRRCPIGARSVKRRRALKIRLVLFLIIIAVCIACVDRLAAPIIKANAEERADAVISNVVYDGALSVMTSDVFKNGGFVSVRCDSSGAVRSVECNTVLLNMFMTLVNNEIEDRIAKDNSGSVSFHLGALFGAPSLMNSGPMLHYKYDLSTNVNCSFLSKFDACGVNQTKHTLTLRVDVKTTVLIPWGSSQRNVVSDFPVAETILVGDVPGYVGRLDLQNGTLYDSENTK